MPRKQSISKEAIIEAAFNILRTRGFDECSVRNISAELGISTMPIYSQFENMEALEQVLFEKTKMTHVEFQKRPYTDNGLMNMSIGSIVFAQDEPMLFRFLHFDRPRKLTKDQKEKLFSDEFVDTINEEMEFSPDADSPFDQSLPDSSAQEIAQIGQKGWIFTHGLATMVYSGMLPKMSVDEIAKLMTEAGTAFYLFHTKEK